MHQSRIISGVLLMAVFITYTSSAEIIIIDASGSGNKTLQYYLCDATEQLGSDTTIELSLGTHVIEPNPSCIAEGLNNFTIRGVTSETSGDVPTLSCASNVLGCGFVFFNMTGLLIENLLIVNFGNSLSDDLPDSVNSTYVYFGVGQKVVLLFSHCINLHLKNILIDSSFGYGVAGVNVMGDTYLNRVVISNTINSRHVDCTNDTEDFSCSGSGAVFVYADDSFTAALQDDVTLRIENAWMVNNTNFVPYRVFVTETLKSRSAFRSDRIPIIGASGLTIYFGHLGYHLDVLIADSVIETNRGDSGSIVFQFYNSVRNSRIHIDNCLVDGNHARSLERGAGIVMALILYLDRLLTNSFPSYPDDIFEILYLSRSTFQHNCAAKVGTIFIYSSPQNVTNLRIRIETTKFRRNIGLIPVMEVETFQSSLVSSDIHLLLQDVEASSNIFSETIESPTLDSNAVFFFRGIHNVTLVGTNDGDGSWFYDNSPGVILAAGGNVFLKGHIKFENNTAISGGAVSLYDSALLYIHKDSKLEFKNNQALQYGGAVFADSSLGTSLQFACAIQFIGSTTILQLSELHRLNISALFTNNTAGVTGNSIYVTPLYECYILPESLFQSAGTVPENKEIHKVLFAFPSVVSNGIEEIASTPHRICICNQTAFIQEHCTEQSLSISTVPGKTFIVHLVAVDAAVTHVASLLYAKLDDIQLLIKPDQAVRQLSGIGCAPIDFTLYGKENSSVNIDLSATPGGLHVSLHITIDFCPPGFVIDYINERKQCSCSDFITSIVGTTCNSTTYTVVRPENSWIGVKYHENETNIAYVNTCPIGYCSEATEVNLSIPNQICDNGRSGILCGQCSDEFSVIFGSAECSKCTNLWLFSLPFFALAGIALVLVLFLANLTVTEGTIHGLIFYANIVGVNTSIFFRNTNRNFLFVFISLLNLELGFPLCFFDGMDEIAKTGLQFVFPSYLLLLSGAIIVLSRYFPRIQKVTASSGVPVLATLIYLSYNKIVQTVIDILSFATLKMQTHDSFVWKFDGNINYCTGLHIFLFIIAILALVIFIIPYTFSLVLIVPLQKYTKLRLKPLVDAYLGPYKDKWRYWFGVRILALPLLSTVSAVRGTDDPGLALLLQLLIVVILIILQASTHPFKNFAIEVVDESFLLNFIILALTFSYLTGLGPNHNSGQEIVVSIMIGLAFVTFVGIITYHTIIALRKIPMLRQKMSKMYSDVMIARGSSKVEEVDIGSYTLTSSKLDTTIATNDGTSTYCELREPLLDP